MATTLQIKRGTGSAVPTGLEDGELAINLDNGKLYFGSGSTSINSFRFENLTAENYIVSSSVTNITTQELSGSTNFGNTSDDTHTFIGSITASGDISSSGTLTANSFIGNGLSIDGPSNSHIEVGEYNVGYDFAPSNTLFITGSGLIISGAMADANHHNMLKIGNVELIDLNTAFSPNEFLIHNVSSFKITSGSDGGDVANEINDIFVHNGYEFFLYKSGEATSAATIASVGTGALSTTTINDQNIVINAANGPSIRALNSTTSPYIAGFSGNPHSNPSSQVQSILASNFFPLVNGAVTASAVSSSGNIYAEDFWDNGVNIKDIYANQNVTGSYAITGSDVIFNHVTASGNISSSGEIEANTFKAGGNVDFNGDLDVDGTTNLDAVDIDGNVQLDGTFTVGVDDTGYDVTLFGATSGRKAVWDASQDHLKLYDNTRLLLGTGPAEVVGDTSLYHDGTDFTFINITGKLNIENSAGDTNIKNTGTNSSINLILDASSAGATVNDGTVLISGSAEPGIRLDIRGEITASGNISSSGEVKAASFRLSNGAFIVEAVNGNITTSNSLTAGNNSSADTHTITGKTTFSGNITASGDINAGGTVIANAFEGTTISANRRNFSMPSDTPGLHEGDAVYFGSTTSMTAGSIYHYKSDGTWELADADAVATSDGLLGVALGAASNTNGVLLRGIVSLGHDAGAIGDVLYVSTNPGSGSATAPSGTNDVVRIVGYKIFHATKRQIWFNPSSDFIIHA